MSEARPAVAFRTLGCKVNQVESEELAAALAARDWRLADEAEADVVVLNTCTVTGEADRKARKAVRHALGLPRGPHVVVTGCLAALDAEGLCALGDRVLVEADKTRVAERVGELAATAMLAGVRDTPARGRTRVQVKVEDGCDAYCAYCIVPYARGVPRAVQLREVVSRVEELAAAGTREVVLTGINVGRYDDEGSDLAALVRAVSDTGIERIRLSSVEPAHLTGRLLEALAGTPAVCPHLHIPLQAGCDRTLDAMDRGYDTAAYERILGEAREALPGLAVSTDVIAGFPGETVADAIETCAFVERCGFMRLHVFRYSRRDGTLAARMPAQVDPRDKQARSERLRVLGEQLASKYAASRVGGTAKVLVERVADGVAEGTSEEYLKVTFPAGRAAPGEIAEVRLTSAAGGAVSGG